MKVRISPEASRDIDSIQAYIRSELSNLAASRAFGSEIAGAMRRLRDNPYLGFDLSSRMPSASGFRCLVSGYYLIVYRLNGSCVDVVRVVAGRTDYVATLFGYSEP